MSEEKMRSSTDEEEQFFEKYSSRFEVKPTEKIRAGGIASYYTSPLAIEEQYKLETGKDATQLIDLSRGTIRCYTDDFVKYTERKLCGVKAGE